MNSILRLKAGYFTVCWMQDGNNEILKILIAIGWLIDELFFGNIIVARDERAVK